jgi:hypothetical protein
MMKSSIVALLILSSMSLFGQGEIPVDMFTGTPSIMIPIWTVEDHDISVPVILQYRGDGLQLQERARFVGVGWDLSGAGRIVRDVRGLPDDFNGISAGLVGSSNYDDRRGWLYNRVNGSSPLAKEISDFSPTSDLSSGTCSDELADYNFINGLYKYSDTEPDVFYVNAPGLATSFVFDNSPTPQIRFLTLTDLKIEYTRGSNSEEIQSFTVTTPGLVKYIFSAITVEMKAHKLLTGATMRDYFKNEHSLYNEVLQQTYTTTALKGAVKFHREWMLTSIESPSGANLTFTYAARQYDLTEPVTVGLRKTTNSGLDAVTLYNRNTTTYYQVLRSITSSSGSQVQFIYPADYLMDHSNGAIKSIRVLDTRRTDPYIKEFFFNHVSIGISNRPYLESLQEKAFCEKLPPYKFSYVGVNLAAGTSSLPASNSASKDFWGFYNGKSNSNLFPTLYVYPALDYPDKVRLERITGYVGTEIILAGADRTPDATSMKMGSLESIQYPTGGKTTIEYEPHTYLDPYTNQTLIGGGLRVKSFKYTDGLNGLSDIVKEFKYEQSAGVTSGRIQAKPVFYMPTYNYQNGGTTLSYEALSAMSAYDVWNSLLLRTQENIAPDESFYGSPVVYSTVTVKRPGSGSVKFVYSTPGSFKATASTDWVPTDNKFSRSASCQNLGVFPTGGTWRYLYARNAISDSEKGLLQYKYEYNEAGTLVRETQNLYKRLYKGGTSVKVWGMKLENIAGANAFVWGKYFIQTQVSNVLEKEIVKVLRTGTTGLTTTVENVFGTKHHYPIETKTTNSDGTVYVTTVKYPLDYGTAAGSADPMTQMIDFMQTNGMVVPIETIKKRQAANDQLKVIGANLTLFKQSSFGVPVLDRTLVASIETPGTFNESSVSGTPPVFTYDTDKYELVGQVGAYDTRYLYPVTITDPIRRKLSTSILGYGHTTPIAAVTDATLEQVGFSDFETQSDASFSLSQSTYGQGRTGKTAVLASTKLSRKISKVGSSYTLSFWAKTDLNPLTVTYVLKNDLLTQTFSTGTITVPATAGKFKYVESKVSVTAVTNAVFVIEVQGNSTNADVTSLIDDIAFYPQNSVVTATTYEIPFGPSSSTGATGKTAYITYDHFGRTKNLMDEDKNIIQTNSYSFSQLVDEVTAEFTVPITETFSLIANRPVLFVAWEDCHPNATYEWNTGSGFFTGPRELTTSFAAGTYTISLRVTVPGYSPVTVSKSITIKPSFTICAKGVFSFDKTYNAVIEYRPCDWIMSTPGTRETIFRVEPPGTTDFVSFVWQYKTRGAKFPWVTASTAPTAIEFVKTISATATVGYDVRCIGTKADGTTVESNIVPVYTVNEIN